MDTSSLFERLPAKPLDRLLLAVQEIQRRCSAGEEVNPPLITLLLRSGRVVRGWLLDLGRDVDEGNLLVRLEAADKRPSPDIAYVTIGSIDGVTIHDAEKVADLISFGKIEGPLGPAPTKLDVKRRAAAVGQKVSEKLKHPIAVEAVWDGDDEATLRRVSAAASDLGVILHDLSGSALGHDALKGIDKIVLKLGESAASKSKGTITLPVAKPGDVPLSRENLKSELEGQL
jgi:hypothetical protein